MVPKIEGSIRVGTTGTIAALINHEIESTKSIPQTPLPYKRRPQTVPVSVHCGVSVKKQQPRRTGQSSTSTSTSSSSRGKSRGNVQKSNRLTAHRVPILSSGDISADSTPNRPKSMNRGYGIVEVVDLKCGNHDKEWSRPITDQLKRLSFSRLSD